MKQFIKDLFQPSKAFARKKQEYLSQFKKSYADRSVAESIVVESLYNIEFLLKNDLDGFEFKNSDIYRGLGSSKNADIYRCLGSIETILVIEGYLNPGNPFPYEKGDTYKSLIIKLGKDYLKSKSVI